MTRRPGPIDATGAGARVGLVHRRLSILDLSEANDQPLVDSTGELAIAYNGEIYNYVELRDELRRLGHVVSLRRRHRGHPARLPAVGRGVRRALRRHVGVRAVRHGRATRCCCRAIASASSRCTCTAPPSGWCSRPRSRPSSPTCGVGAPVRANRPSIATYVATGLVDGLEDTFFDGISRFPAASTAVHRRRPGARVRPRRYWDLLPDAPACAAA